MFRSLLKSCLKGKKQLKMGNGVSSQAESNHNEQTHNEATEKCLPDQTKQTTTEREQLQKDPTSTSDEQEDLSIVIKRFVDTMRFVETYEETRLMIKSKTPFVREYLSDDDWSDTSRLRFGTTAEFKNFKLALCSYQAELWMNIFPQFSSRWPDAPLPPVTVCTNKERAGEATPFFLRIENPVQYPSSTMPEIVKEYLLDLKKQNGELFEMCKAPIEILDILKLDDLLSTLNGTEETTLTEAERKTILDFAEAHWATAPLIIELAPLYKLLHSHWNADEKAVSRELIFGFAHIRKKFDIPKKSNIQVDVESDEEAEDITDNGKAAGKRSTKSKSKEGKDKFAKRARDTESKLVNGPLFEVVVEVLQEDDTGLVIIPKKNARVRLNAEVWEALIASGGGNTQKVDELRRAVAECMANELVPGDSNTYLRQLKLARSLCYSGQLKLGDDSSLHTPPTGTPALVVAPGWFLYERPKRSSPASLDTVAIVAKVQDGSHKLPPATAALMGVKEEEEDAKMTESKAGMAEEDVCLPLCASKAQRQIIEDFHRKKPHVQAIQGPPGCGKTQTCANLSLLELARGGRVLVTSNNAPALTAYVEKLPVGFRKLCVDMSSLEADGIAKLHGKIEVLEEELRDVWTREGEFSENLKHCKAEIARKREERSYIENTLEQRSIESRQLVETEEFQRLVKSLLNNASKAWVIRGAVASKDIEIDSIMDKLESIPQLQAKKFGFGGEITQQLLDRVTQRATGSDELKQGATDRRLVSSFHGSAKAVDTDVALDGLMIDGKHPSTQGDWQYALHRLQLEEAVLPLQAVGCDDAYDEDGLVARSCLLASLKKMKEVRTRLAAISPEQKDKLQDFLLSLHGIDSSTCLRNFDKEIEASISSPGDDVHKKLGDIISSVGGHRALQAYHRKLDNEIIQLESDVVYSEVMLQLSQLFSKKHYQNLKRFSQAISRSREKENQRYESFRESFRECVAALPLLVMTSTQVHQLVPPDHSFDLCIIDEASQSVCTAMCIFARAKRLVAVGDDKQNSPAVDNKFRGESMKGLATFLPKIAAPETLMPGISIFDTLRATFENLAVLKDHFRCPPESIAWSNETKYHNQLDLYRPPRRESSLVAVRVNGEGSKAKGNKAECDKIVESVRDSIMETIKLNRPPRTIGIVSMGGPAQCKLIDNELRKALVPIEDKYTPEAVKRHSIIVTEPSGIQGNERDDIYISTVYGPENVPLQTTIAEENEWNVAITRNKNRTILVHSYDITDIKHQDIKREIFGHFYHARLPRGSTQTGKEKAVCLRGNMEQKLRTRLEEDGFEVKAMQGNVWSDALCVRGKADTRDICVLVCIENHGESIEKWRVRAEQQTGLERAGTPCLRVDCLSALLNFEPVLGDVHHFLIGCGLTPAKLRSPCGVDPNQSGLASLPTPTNLHAKAPATFDSASNSYLENLPQVSDISDSSFTNSSLKPAPPEAPGTEDATPAATSNNRRRTVQAQSNPGSAKRRRLTAETEGKAATSAKKTKKTPTKKAPTKKASSKKTSPKEATRKRKAKNVSTGE